MHQGQYPLADGGTAAAVVGVKDCLSVGGYMNPTNTNTGGWDSTYRRSWCNTNFKNSLPQTFSTLFKQMLVRTAGIATPSTSIDYFALFAEKEVFGSNSWADATAEAGLFQMEYFKTTEHRIKKLNSADVFWWERSPVASRNNSFCSVNATGDALGYVGATGNDGIAPFGCI